MSVSIKESLTFIDSPYEFLKQFDAQNTVLFIDENVYEHHSRLLAGFEQIIIPSGEEQKCFEVVQMLLETLLESGLDRKGTIIGIGGGVVTDLTGFIASTYLRGVKFGFLPTTVLAMCDAAIGGKNGINFGSFKNMVGVINQPSFIAYYTPFLQSLPAREFNSGLAEVIKHAVINGGEIHTFLVNETLQSIQSDNKKLTHLCQLAAQVKVDVVEKDELESGLRKILNLGHTIGHAIESTSASLNNAFTHGEAISIGMVLAAKISVMKGLTSDTLVTEISELCVKFGLPIHTKLNPELLLEKIVKDKKRTAQTIDFILPLAFGNVQITPIEISELSELLNRLANG